MVSVLLLDVCSARECDLDWSDGTGHLLSKAGRQTRSMAAIPAWGGIIAWQAVRCVGAAVMILNASLDSAAPRKAKKLVGEKKGTP